MKIPIRNLILRIVVGFLTKVAIAVPTLCPGNDR